MSDYSKAQRYRISAGCDPDTGRAVLDRPVRPSDIVIRGWCQGSHAARRDDSPCKTITDPLACRFDVLGAVLVARLRGYDPGRKVSHLIASMNSFKTLSLWNDAPERTQAEVVAILRGAGL